MIYLRLFCVLTIASFGSAAYAQCKSSVNFNHLATVNTGVTVTGIPAPVRANDAVNKFYVDDSILSIPSFVQVNTNSSDSLLATNYIGDDVTNQRLSYIDVRFNGDRGAFFTDEEAGHPLSASQSARHQAYLTYPSNFTEHTLTEVADGSADITQFFLSTAQVRSAAGPSSESLAVQMVTEAANINNTANESMGTVGGVFYRYRDDNQYANEWSNWQRLDNREIDSQFARVDALKLDGTTISVDARTPFSLNTSITNARASQQATSNIDLTIRSKGDERVYFGRYTDVDDTYVSSADATATYNMYIDGDDQIIRTTHASIPFTIDVASDEIGFSGDAVGSINNISVADTVTALTSATFANLEFTVSRLRSTSGSLHIDAANRHILFSDNLLSGIGSLDVGDMTLVGDTVSSDSSASLVLQSAQSVIDFSGDAIQTDSVWHNQDIDIAGNGITSSSGTLQLISNSDTVDFNQNQLVNIDSLAVVTANASVSANIGDLRIHDATISTANGRDLVFRAQTSTLAVDFSDKQLTQVEGLEVGNLDIDGDSISGNNTTFDADNDVISFSGASVFAMNSLFVNHASANGLLFDAGSITTTSGTLTVNGANVVNFSDDTLQTADRVVVGQNGTLTTLATASLRSEGNLTVTTRSSGRNRGSVFFNNGTTNGAIENVSRLAVANITFDGTTLTHQGANNNAGGGFGGGPLGGGFGGTTNNLELEASGNINFRPASGQVTFAWNTITNVASPTSAQDAATVAYVNSKRINELGVADGALDMGGFRITNLATTTTTSSANQLATKQYVDSVNIDNWSQVTVSESVDFNNHAITGLGQPTTPDAAVRRDYQNLADLDETAAYSQVILAPYRRELSSTFEAANFEYVTGGFTRAATYLNNMMEIDSSGDINYQRAGFYYVIPGQCPDLPSDMIVSVNGRSRDEIWQEVVAGTLYGFSEYPFPPHVSSETIASNEPGGARGRTGNLTVRENPECPLLYFYIPQT